MARPVNADAERTRARILDVARSMVSTHGIDGVSIRDIARESGVTLATVHHYFGTKDALHEACIEQMYADLRVFQDAVTPAFQSGRPLPEVVEEVVRAGFRFAVEHRNTQRLLMRTVVERGLDPARRESVLEPYLAQGSVLLGFLAGKPAYEMRFVLQSLSYLNMRYSIAQDDELRAIAQVDDLELARNRVEDHLVAYAFAMLGLERRAAAPRPKRKPKKKESHAR